MDRARRHRTKARMGGAPAWAPLLVALLALPAARAAALTVTVPDDFKTIQQAIDSGASEILVRPGSYPETPVINDLPHDSNGYVSDLVVRGLVPPGTPPDSLPVITGLVFDDLRIGLAHDHGVAVDDLRISDAVENRFHTAPYSNPFGIGFLRCVLGGGINDDAATVGGQLEYDLLDCRIDGPIRLRCPQRAWLVNCSVHAPVDLPPALNYLQVTGCDFQGPGSYAIQVGSNDYGEIRDCHFVGFETPIRDLSQRPNIVNNTFVGPGVTPVQTPEDNDLYFYGNHITGFQTGVLGSGGDLDAANNVIENCGAAVRWETSYYSSFDGNVVRSCGSGVAVAARYDLEASGNIVDSCATDGMVLNASRAVVEKNVVGRCGGVGIRLTSTAVDARFSHLVANTSYRNGGSGFVVSAPRVERNSAFGNGGHGLEFAGPDSVHLGCNDWFANAAGPVSGIAMSSSDLALDPLFCDVAQGDVHLSAGSPLLASAGCDTIGALGEGCDAPIIARLTAFTAASATDGVEVRWQVADTASGFVAWVERADAATGPWSKVGGELVAEGDAMVEHDRTTEPARSYWYRLVATDRGTTRPLGDAVRVETDPPTRFALLSTGANPSPGALEATFQLAHAADITLELFDTQGRRVATLAHGTWPAGIHKASLGGAQPPSGAYFLRYRHPQGEDLRRIAIVR